MALRENASALLPLDGGGAGPPVAGGAPPHSHLEEGARMDRRSLSVLALALALLAALPLHAEPPTADLGNWTSPCYNCYNYGTNKTTAFFAQPGGPGTIPAGGVTCDNVTKGATGDGLVQVVWSPGDP